MDVDVPIEDIFLDNDNILYGLSSSSFYKILDTCIPLSYDWLYFITGSYFFISNNHLFTIRNDSAFDSLRRVPNNIKGLKPDSNIFLYWEDKKIFFLDKVVELNFIIDKIEIFRDIIFLLSSENVFYIYKDNQLIEIINLDNNILVDMCINKFLPVVAFLVGDNIFILDTNIRKIVKVIKSYNGRHILFKNKRELFIISDKVVEYHLGKDSANVIIEGSSDSVFRHFEVNTEVKFVYKDMFKEEVRTKLIENKIQNKR